MKITTNCEHCKESFNPSTTRARFCSDKCRVYHWRKKVKDLKQPSITFDKRYQEEFDRLMDAIQIVLVHREFFGDLPEHYKRYDDSLTELYRAYYGLIQVSDQYAPYQTSDKKI